MSFFSRFIEIFEDLANRKTLTYLRTLSEHQQLEYGLSPALLKQGIKAWPWKAAPETFAPHSFVQILIDDQITGETEQANSSFETQPIKHLDAA